MDPAPAEVTQLLNRWCKGDGDALERLAALVESELRRLASLYLSKEMPGNTLQPTALVNEAYLRLIEWNTSSWQNRTHFYVVATKIMRQVLVNHAVARRRQKRGGSAVLVSLSEATVAGHGSADMIQLNDALIALARIDERKSRVVELRFFGGLTPEETADALGISLRTVHRDWDFARAWLFRELQGGAGTG